MADDCHDEFAPATFKRAFDPRALSVIHSAQDARIYCNQCKIVGLQFKKGARWLPELTAYKRRMRSAYAVILSMRRASVLVNFRSASTRASIAARAALGSRKLALNPSSASNQS